MKNKIRIITVVVFFLLVFFLQSHGHFILKVFM